MQITKRVTIKNTYHNAFPTYITYQGTEYLAFRSAGSHFSLKDSKIVIYTRSDGPKWIFLQEFAVVGWDSRDPEFGVINGELCLVFVEQTLFLREIYFSKLSQNNFSTPKKLGISNMKPAKFTTILGKTILLTYEEKSLQQDSVYVFEINENGVVINSKRIEGLRGTESDLIDNNGGIIGVTRIDKSLGNEAGSYIFSLNEKFEIMKKVYVSQRFDSPELFCKNGIIYMLSRATKSFGGIYNISRIPFAGFLNTIINILIYWLTPKVLRLSQIDKDLSITKVLDLPTSGDTGYSSTDGKKVFTYSSLGKNMESSWLKGQMGDSEIIEFEMEW